MKTKSGILRFEWWIGLIASIASIAVYGLWPEELPKVSWVQTCGDCEFRIENGEVLRPVNPYSYPVSVLIEDTSGVSVDFQKIPSGMVGGKMRCREGWTCTVWAQGIPVGFIKVRRPE